ncbi:DOMON-like domain-containing protein [Brevundimonas sp.]|uniref:DOMON-like domain-containing protein n=1 Tax=Brevundimonas sp. TaxID=1871086 RepID=UPI0026304BBD|nr:DOMON-like domain-containing protein [Brevundimonas sp.]
MRATLIPYPDSASSPIERIEVEFDFEGRPSALVTFRLFGDTDRIAIHAPSASVARAKARDQWRLGLFLIPKSLLRLPLPWRWMPAPTPVGRADGLWQHTCLEVFAARPDGCYAEFNLSPSNEWAAYFFDGYRDGMRPLKEASVQVHAFERSDGELKLRASVYWQGWMATAGLGFSAVIEDVDGKKTYWALAHPSDKPDFHHPDSFAIPMSTPENP